MAISGKEILKKVESNYSGEDLELIKKAYYFAEKAHENQKRASGEPYFIHPCAVASTLIDLGLDAPTVAAAFLHDVIEDTSVSENVIKAEFGDEVLELVLGVTKLERIAFTSTEEEQAENFRKIFVAMAKDIRVIMIKLSDRLHNMRSLNFLSEERRKRIAKETLDIFAPLADRLGMAQVKYELEDLCLRYLEPDMYDYITDNIKDKVSESEKLSDSVIKVIDGMMKESNITGEVFARKKHIYSIYRKMVLKGKSLEQIYDLVAIRILVNSVEECYEILGKIHNMWKPIPGRIKDYIATPKPNMYRSLHTTVVTNYGWPFEIQIRTYEMHHTAEYGIAAHWKYKENKKDADELDTKLSWIREVMEWQGGLKDSKEFLDSVKSDIYNSEIFVFTPKGDVKSLPKGATPLDFAYSIHSIIGNKCVGAKVNSQVVPLNTELEVGDVVEIMTSLFSKGPSWDWLKIVKSPASKVKIKQFFRRAMRGNNVKSGKKMLETEAKNKGFELSDLLTDDAKQLLFEKMSFSSENEMYATIGYGAVSVNQVLVKLIDYYRKRQPRQEMAMHIFSDPQKSSGVKVKGAENVPVRFAGCCNPIPGDDIIGYISRGHGVTVHRKDCHNLINAEKAQLIEVSWADRIVNAYNVHIKVIGNLQTEVLGVVVGVVSKLQLEIISVNGRSNTGMRRAAVDFNIRINKKDELDIIMTEVKKDDRILEVYRMAT